MDSVDFVTPPHYGLRLRGFRRMRIAHTPACLRLPDRHHGTPRTQAQWRKMRASLHPPESDRVAPRRVLCTTVLTYVSCSCKAVLSRCSRL
eukprot:1516365-Prymnesium_polylepis.1